MSATLREHKDKATALFAKGRFEAALAELRKAQALAPKDAALRQKVAEVLAKLGRTAEAVAQYQQLVGHFAIEGQLLRSIALCKVILQLEPGHTQTQATLADLYHQRGDVVEGETAVVPAAMAPPPEVREETPEPARPATDLPVEVAKLARIPLFSELAREEFAGLFDLVQVREAKTGETIVKEGEPGRSLFAIASGAVEVEHAQPGATPLPLARLEAGDFFGEMALVANVPRLATVRAAVDSTLLELPREALATLAKRHPRVDAVVQQFYKLRLLENLLHSNPLFSAFTESEQLELVERFRPRTFEADTVLIEQGRPGVAFYVLLRGRCRVTYAVNGHEEELPELGEGEVFGEIALLQERASTATVRTLTKAVVLGLHKHLFHELFATRPGVMLRLGHLVEERLRRLEPSDVERVGAFRSRAV